MKGIDKIFWINSNQRPDRFRNMKQRLSDLNIDAERFPALYGGAVNWNTPEYSIFYKHNIKQELNNGEIGCFLSHRKLWETIKANGWKRTLILEDDAMFLEGFFDVMEGLHGKLKTFDMLYLGQWNYDVPGDKGIQAGEKSALKEKIGTVGNRELYKAQRCWLTHAYIVDIKVIDKLIDNSKNIYGSIDRVLADLQEELNLEVYSVYPNIINQDFTKSSLRNI